MILKHLTILTVSNGLRCASVAMDSPSASPSKAEYTVCGATAEDAGPCPRSVSSEELHILQTCLTRWRTEVEQDIKGAVSLLFTSNLPVIDLHFLDVGNVWCAT